MDLMLYQNQLGDDHKFDDWIYQAQKRFKDPDPWSVHMELGDKTKMFSSSGRGGLFAGHGLWPGVGTRFADRTIIDPEKWKIYPMNITEVEELAIWHWFLTQRLKRYDWTGIIGQPFPGNIQLFWMWYCSEVCHRAIWMFCREKPIPEMRKIRPGQVVEIYKKAGLIAA